MGVQYPLPGVMFSAVLLQSVSNSSHILFALGSVLEDFMAYTRGSMDDYDRWANVTGDDQWSWDSLFPYMTKVNISFLSSYIILMSLKLEQFTPSTDGHDTSDELDIPKRGHSGK
jgi:hypothetical protein